MRPKDRLPSVIISESLVDGFLVPTWLEEISTMTTFAKTMLREDTGPEMVVSFSAQLGAPSSP